MTRQRQIIAAWLAAVAVLVVLSSSAFILSHADHDCSGEDCPICEQLYACTQNLKNLAAALAAAAAVITLVVFLRTVLRYAQADCIQNTPVHLKVKLSN